MGKMPKTSMSLFLKKPGLAQVWQEKCKNNEPWCLCGRPRVHEGRQLPQEVAECIVALWETSLCYFIVCLYVTHRQSLKYNFKGSQISHNSNMPNMPPTPVNRRKNINMNQHLNQLTLSPPNHSLSPNKVTPMFPGGDNKYHPGHLFQSLNQF